MEQSGVVQCQQADIPNHKAQVPFSIYSYLLSYSHLLVKTPLHCQRPSQLALASSPPPTYHPSSLLFHPFVT